jgi:hypothetical protein
MFEGFEHERRFFPDARHRTHHIIDKSLRQVYGIPVIFGPVSKLVCLGKYCLMIVN